MPPVSPIVKAERRISDPLAAVLAPPPGETPEERELRLQQEREAKKISDTIDEQLRQEKEALKAKSKGRREIKVLLLGQSESGKSTTLKQFQLTYTPNAFHEERVAWRPVVYLNLVRSVRRIIDALSPPELDLEPPSTPNVDGDETNPTRNSISEPFQRPGTSDSLSLTRYFLFARPEYVELKARLAPFLALEDRLMKQLSATDDDEATQLFPPAAESPSQANGQAPAKKNNEMSINNRHNWKKALKFGMGSKPRDSDSPAGTEGWWNDPSDPCHVVDAARPDIERLWEDRLVQSELRKKRLRLEESSGFYLDSIPRVTNIRYIPSEIDVLRARLKTLGVVEHTFSLDPGKPKGMDWKIYDVGGARSQRNAWVPFFADVNALIFLAPISAFDQVLAEDPRVNRLEDSLYLWRAIVANKLLAGVNMILFLNKCDLLKAKLEAGVKLNAFMTSYGDRPNDPESVTKYFRNKFLALNLTYTPNPNREIYLHLTSVTDTEKTSTIIANVRDIILRDDLRDVKLL